MGKKPWMKWLRLIHRYTGLTLAVFIILVSLTGSLLAFYPELERLTTPDWYAAKQKTIRLDLPQIAEKVHALNPQVVVTTISFNEQDRVLASVIAKINPQTGQAFPLDYSEYVLDPYTGELLGQRNWGVIREGWHNLMPFIYEFHYSLALNNTGIWVLGIAALVWCVDCFTGLLITFPEQGRHQRHARKPWLSQWKKAWLIKWRASKWRINFDLHRALSLWLWVVLLVFAWSSVYMNLWDTFYTQVTRTLMPFHPPWYDLASRQPTATIPPQNWQVVYARAQIAMNDSAQQQGFTIIAPNSLRYYPNTGTYRYRVLSSLDISDRHARTDIFLDAITLEPVFTYYPRKQYIGNTVSNWLYALHTARVWGMPYRVFVCVLGIVLVVITLTGVLIWWKRFNRVVH